MKKNTELNPEWKKAYDEEGFVVIRAFLDAGELDELKARLSRYIAEIVPELEATESFYEDKDRPETLKQLFRLTEHDAFFEKEIAKGKFKQLAGLLVGEGAVDKGVMYFNKPPRVGQPTPPHQDAYYWKIAPCNGLTMWLPLEDVDEENGCLHYSRGSHKKEMREHRTTETLGFSQGITDFPNDDDRAGDCRIEAKAGDLLVHHGKTVHWAGGNDSVTKSRPSIGVVYYGAEVEEDEEQIQAYQDKLHRELEEAGKI